MATLGVLVDRVRRNLQEVSANAGNQSLYSTPNIKYWIGEGYRYYSLLMIEQGEGYFEEIQNLPLTAGDPDISLASLNPVYFKLSVLRRNTPTGSFPLRSSEKRFTATNLYGGTTAYYTDFKYRFKGRTTIVLDPVPQTTEIASATTGLQVEYIYLPTFPSYDTVDSFEFDSNFSPIFDDLPVLWATIAALDSKDGTGVLSDVATFRQRKELLEERFTENLVQTEDPDSVRYIGNDYTYDLYYGR